LRLLKTKKPRASVCPRLRIKLDDQSTHGQTAPVKIKIIKLPGLIDIMLTCYLHFAPLLFFSFSKWIRFGCQVFFQKFFLDIFSDPLYLET